MAEIIGRVGWRNYVSPISPLWNNLVAYWSGDNTANDSKGTYNGTLVNGTTYATGKINNGFSLDGVNDYVNFGNNLDFSGTTPFSFSVWVKPTALGEVNCILSKMVAATAQGYYLRLQNGIRFALYGIYPNGVVVTTTTPIPLNVFTHITLTYSGNGLGNGFKIYVNGVNTTLNIEANGFSGSSSNTAEFSLGSQYSGGSAGVFFQGIIDEVGAWSRALTASEVAELYNAGAGKQYVAPAPTSIITTGLVMNLDAGNTLSYAGTGTTWTDLSGNANNGTLINGTSYSSANGGTMVFDGINDQALINNSNSINITTSLTIEGWIKPTSIAGWIAIFYKNTNSVNGGYHLGIDPSGYLAGGLKETSWTTVQSTTNQIQTNTWQQIAMSLDLNNKVLKLYKNGILIKTQTSFNYTLTGNTSPLSIGAQSNGGETFLGSIPICRLYNAVLTDADITSNFNATKTRFGL